MSGPVVAGQQLVGSSCIPTSMLPVGADRSRYKFDWTVVIVVVDANSMDAVRILCGIINESDGSFMTILANLLTFMPTSHVPWAASDDDGDLTPG